VDDPTPRRISGAERIVWENAVTGAMSGDEQAAWQILVVQLQGLRPFIQLDDLERYRFWGPRIARFSFVLSTYGARSASRPDSNVTA
jgi:hypothetical protein